MYYYIIIDDEALIRKGTIKKISPIADTVECIGEADNGRAGIDLILDKHPDFVIMDMQMPIMGGMDLLPYLAKHFPNMPLIVISGYKNFDYIKQAISANAVEYLLKPFSAQTIQDCIRQVITRLEERSHLTQQLKLTEEEAEKVRYDYDISMLHNLILGYHTTGSRLTSKRLNYINDTHDLVLVTLSFSDAADDSGIPVWLNENGFGDLALYISGRDAHQNIGFLILFLPEQPESLSQNLSRQVIRSFLDYAILMDDTSCLGVSRLHHSLKELSDAFEETSTALNLRPLKDSNNHIYTISEKSDVLPISWERTEEFLFRIEAGMDNDVSDMCSDLFLYYNTIPGCRLGDIKLHCQLLADDCRQLLNLYMNTPEHTSKSASMQNVAQHIFTVHEIQEYYRQFFLNVTAMLKPHSIYRNEDPVENIKTYLQRNYYKNLTQDFLASLFYLNRSYLSSLFRTRTGEKFVDYLNDIRLEHAEELLQNPDQKMRHIAHAVGYDNEKYFFRIFKKRVGMTPDQYRKQLQKQSADK
jgi:two-component system response regulator YesN